MSIVRLTYSFVLLALLVSSAQAEWTRVESGTLAWLRAIQFVDAKTGWIAGSSGTLLKTEDGGISWKKRVSPTTDNIHDLFFQDAKVGWLLCEKDRFRESALSPTYILKTTDGGETWEDVDIEAGTERVIRLVGASSNGLVLGLGETGTLLQQRRDESGQFVRRRLADKALLLSGAVLESGEMLLVGGAGSILRTEDGGRTWGKVFVQGEVKAKLNSIFFLDSSRGWIVGAEGFAFRSQNGGKSWSKLSTGVQNGLNDVLFLNDTVGLAVGENGTIITTQDGGHVWTRSTSGTTHRLERLTRNGISLFTVGFGGAIFVDRVNP